MFRKGFFFWKKYSQDDILLAHKYCTNNREMLVNDNICGCFYCCRIFNPNKIKIDEWWDNGKTAVCPYCGIDSIIGKSSGYPITRNFLKQMKKYWFDGC